MSSPTPRWQLDTLDPSQTGADVTHNLAIIKLDFLSGGAIHIKNITTTTPPGSPALGDGYLVGTGGTGAWATHDGQLALWYNGWYFFIPVAGAMYYDEGANVWKRYNGSTWSTF